jgi:hypothetical protein
LWITTGAEGSAGCEAISAYVSPWFCFSVVMGRPRVGGWGFDFDLDDLAWSRTFACYVSSILMSGLLDEGFKNDRLEDRSRSS